MVSINYYYPNLLKPEPLCSVLANASPLLTILEDVVLWDNINYYFSMKWKSRKSWSFVDENIESFAWLSKIRQIYVELPLNCGLF